MAAKFSCNVLYGPDLYKGMNIQHPYYKQGIQKIITCVQESFVGSQTEPLIKFVAEEFILEIGMPLTLGTVNWDIVGGYVTPNWLGHIAKFVSAQELDIKNNFHKTALLRQNNDYIKLCFIEHGYRKQDLYILHQMQMSLHAISLSDITTSDNLIISQNKFLLIFATDHTTQETTSARQPSLW